MNYAGHCELGSPPDLDRVMEALSTLPEGERERIMRSMMSRFQADPLSQDAIRKNWEKVKDDFGKDGEATKKMMKGEKNLHYFTTTQSWDVKPDSPPIASNKSSALKTLTPIQISDMELGHTHRGRFLVGTIADTDGLWTINSGAFLLQDLSGCVIEVAVYNSPRTKFAREFHLGREICISEPFLKIRADGTAGIRIDRPSEIIGYALPRTSEEWKELGNSFIKQCPQMALTCYDKSLQAPSKKIMESTSGKSALTSDSKATAAGTLPPNSSGKAKRRNKKQQKKSQAQAKEDEGKATKVVEDAANSKLEVSKVLTNISLCQASAGNFDSSLLYALLAFGLGVDQSKAAFRVAKALDLSGLKKEAMNFASWYCSAHERDSKSNKNSLFRKEFKTTHADDIEEGASWVQADTLERLVKASSSVKEASPSLLASIRSRAAENDLPWLLAKQYGNDAFHDNDLPKAIEYYVAALSLCPFAESILRDSSFIVSNKGAAWLGIIGEKRPAGSTPEQMLLVEGAVSMLSAALMNFHDNGRASIRVSRFLLRSGRQDESISFLAVATSLLKKRAFRLPFYHAKEPQPPRALALVQSELTNLQQRMSSGAKVEKVGDVSTDEQLRQRKAEGPDRFNATRAGRKKLEDDIMEYEQGYSMQSMMEMMLNDNAKVDCIRTMTGPTKNRKLDDYSAEFVKARGVPNGLDNEYAQRVLYRSFVADRMHPWFPVMGWRMAWSKGDNDLLKSSLMSEGDLLKRWHSTAALELISEFPETYASVGAIVDIRHMKPKSHSSYDSRIRSNFVNCPSHFETLYEGTTHLAIGFNDLNSLMNCKWRQSETSDNKGQPSRFVGLEMNAFNVAKTVVIVEMLSNQSVPLESVLQAWFSTVWSRSTLVDYKDCVKTVLSKSEQEMTAHRASVGGFAAENVSNPKVASYLHHWLSAEPLSFKEARRQWLDNTVEQNIKIFHSISSCKRRKDRLALGHYFLTGEVFANPDFSPNGLNAVGSLPFWCCPEGSPPLEEDSIFNAFLLDDLMATLAENKARDLVQAFEARALNKLKDIRSRLVKGKLTVELYIGAVKPLADDSGHDLVHFVARQLKPHTIDWSNVIDYMPLQELHNLGRAMSPGGAIHSGYSMNWPCEVFGANVFDYQTINNHESANMILDLALGENFGGNNQSLVNLLRAHGANAGADRVLHYPDHDTPMNSTSYVAAIFVREHWIEHFFSTMAESDGSVGGRLESSPAFRYTPSNCGSMEMAHGVPVVAPCTLHRQSTQLYLKWAYDPKLQAEVEYAASPILVSDSVQEKVKALLKKK